MVKNGDQNGASDIADHDADHYSDGSFLPMGSPTGKKRQQDEQQQD